MITKIVNHSKRVGLIAQKFGWLVGARYTNLRDIREFDDIGLIDICWNDYDFERHYEVVQAVRPRFTIARDVMCSSQLRTILKQASRLAQFADNVIVVPKCLKLGPKMGRVIPREFILGYSVPTRYGGTEIPKSYFQRPVHLLGGRPDVQRELAKSMPVTSFDCNRFTLDARFGDYFDGATFRPHPVGGYELCIRDSIVNICDLWEDYRIEQGGAGNVAPLRA